MHSVRSFGCELRKKVVSYVHSQRKPCQRRTGAQGARLVVDACLQRLQQRAFAMEASAHDQRDARTYAHPTHTPRVGQAERDRERLRRGERDCLPWRHRRVARAGRPAGALRASDLTRAEELRRPAFGRSASLAGESGAENASKCPGSINRLNAPDTLQALSVPQINHGSKGFVFATLGSLGGLARWQSLAHRNTSACSGGIGAPPAPETLQARHVPLS